MGKSKKKKGEKAKKDWDIQKGVLAIKLSISFLFLSTLLLILVLIIKGFDTLEISKIVFSKPKLESYVILFAGSILFIVIPFVLGAKFSKKKLRYPK